MSAPAVTFAPAFSLLRSVCDLTDKERAGLLQLADALARRIVPSARADAAEAGERLDNEAVAECLVDLMAGAAPDELPRVCSPITLVRFKFLPFGARVQFLMAHRNYV